MRRSVSETQSYKPLSGFAVARLHQISRQSNAVPLGQVDQTHHGVIQVARRCLGFFQFSKLVS